MYQTHHAAKGDHYGSSKRHLLYRSMQRAAVNIYKTETSYEMLVFAAGRIKEHFKIDVEGNLLTISCEPEETVEEKEEKVSRKEDNYSSFERSFTLPDEVNKEKIDARYNDGILEIKLPKKEEAKKLSISKQIEVK